MPGRKAVPARAIRSIHVPTVKDPDSARAFDIMIAAVQDLQAARNRDVVTFNLVVGTNRIAHGLGRPCLGYTLTKTVTDASFDHAIDTANPRKDLEIWITVIGVSQDNAIIEVF